MTHTTLLPTLALTLLPTPAVPAAPAAAADPPAAPAAVTSVVTGPLAAGRWPLEPRPQIVRGFEPPPQPWLPGHRGVDLLGTPGQAVLTTAPGIIRYAGQLAGRGIVVVSHGTTRTTYEPVIPSVQVGATVSAGTQIGRLSAVGSHCPPRPCLHWGLLHNTTYLNPLTLLTTPPIRLLPLTPPPTLGTRTPPTPAMPPRTPNAINPPNQPTPTLRTTNPPDQPIPTFRVTNPPTDTPSTPTVEATESTEPRSNSTSHPTTPQSTASPGIWGSPTGTAVVCLATLLTAIATLLIRRH